MRMKVVGSVVVATRDAAFGERRTDLFSAKRVESEEAYGRIVNLFLSCQRPCVRLGRTDVCFG
jgi:hypothetical protein